VRYPPRPTKLDPYQALIRARLDTYPELTAVRLFDEVRAAGYAGSLTQLKVFVRQIRPRPEPDPVVRFETAPGHQGQVDFARFAFPWGVRYGLFVVLGYSRLLWLQFVARQTMRVLMQGLEQAFHAFGGVPRELLFDQLKAVILFCRRELPLHGAGAYRGEGRHPRGAQRQARSRHCGGGDRARCPVTGHAPSPALRGRAEHPRPAMRRRRARAQVSLDARIHLPSALASWSARAARPNSCCGSIGV
jgi:transposase